MSSKTYAHARLSGIVFSPCHFQLVWQNYPNLAINLQRKLDQKKPNKPDSSKNGLTSEGYQERKIL